MFLKILQHTPLWVFVLFFVLLALGLLQTKDRTIKRGTVFVLPCAMLILSFYGVISAFGITYKPLFSWVFGLIAAIAFGLAIAKPKNVICFKSNNSFNVSGSWMPLFLMMGIFFTKYVAGVAFARQLSIVQDGTFVLTISWLYGFFSGLFFSRGLVIWKSIKIHKHKQKSVQPPLDSVIYQLQKGAGANLPVAASVAAYGSVLGVLAAQKGISWQELLVMSLTVFAGSAQFVMVDMWGSQLPVLEIIFAVFIINLRYLLIGASLNPLFQNSSIRQKSFIIHFVADENWAVTMAESRNGTATVWFLLGGGLCLGFVWCSGALIGHQFGAAVKHPELWALDFTFAAVFTALAVNLWRGKKDILPWIGAAVIASLAANIFPGKWYIIAGGVGGALLQLLPESEGRKQK